MSRSSAAIVATVLLAVSITVHPRAQAPSPRRADQPYTSATTAILVDVVVRDKRGRPVTDLAAGDFALSEDGVPQKIDTFTRVSRGSGIGVGVAWKSPGTTNVAVASASPPAGAAPAEEPQADATVALVFDHLSAENLRLAQRATLGYIPMNGESAARVGVFATDPGVRMLQPYTTDTSLVRNAVSRVLPGGTSAQEQHEERTDQLVDRRRDLRGDNAAATSGGMSGSGPALARTAAEVGQRETELRLVQTELNMLRAFDNMDRDHRGYDSAAVLHKVIQTLSQYPGRKTIVFFSEGLPASPALSARLDMVIEAANRANVTAYAVDAHGLRSKSTLGTMRKEIDTFAEERLVQTASGTDRTEQPLTMAFERVEDTLKLDSRTGLARLAQDTGGFLIEQSNDLSSAFRRIDEDNRFHYLLTYSPANSEFDGKFRTIQVKVRRPGTQVFSRKGYRAIRTGGPDSTGYEVPALALADLRPLPNAFPIRAAGFSFPDPDRPGLTPILVDVSTGTLRFAIDAERATYSAQAVILVRLRDVRGQEVQKLSQQYVLTGDAADVDAARRGTILFYREPDLPPGIYTMETIVLDANANSGSVRMATLTVPPAERSRLGMSSLILVKKVEEAAASADPSAAAAPLYVGNRLLYPNLGEPIRKAAATELPFFFTLYGSVQQVQASAQLLRNGQAVAEAPMQIPATSGARIQHVGSLPIAGLPAGTYELRIRVSDGRQELSRTAFLTIE